MGEAVCRLRVERSDPARVCFGARRLPATSEPAQRDADNQLELVLRSGARLRFPVGTDLSYLQALAAAL